MRLKDYLSSLDIDMRVFARQAGITEGTVRNVVIGKRDVTLTTAIKIEKATMGVVKCKDLLPENFEF